jgi:hypothetical protein
MRRTSPFNFSMAAAAPSISSIVTNPKPLDCSLYTHTFISPVLHGERGERSHPGIVDDHNFLYLGDLAERLLEVLLHRPR